MSPLEKVVFEKNMCLSDTSVRGKKWQRALFQVDSTIQNSFHGEKTEKEPPLKVRTGKPMTTTAI